MQSLRVFPKRFKQVPVARQGRRKTLFLRDKSTGNYEMFQPKPVVIVIPDTDDEQEPNKVIEISDDDDSDDDDFL